MSKGTTNATLTFDKVYPVGSIYMSVNNTSPASLFGGTWEQLKDRFLLGCGDTYSNGATGGEASHVLTEEEMPSHEHELSLGTGTFSAGVPSGYRGPTGIVSGSGRSASVGGSGGDGYNYTVTPTGSASATGGGRHTTICPRTSQSICGRERPESHPFKGVVM